MKLGERIQKLRKEKGYSQEYFAKILGIGRSTLANYEQCKRDPTYETIELIADKLNTTPAYLMGWADINGEIIGLKKKPTNIISFDFRDDINFIKLDKYQLLKSGIFKTYLDNQDKYFKWYYGYISEIEKNIENLNKCITFLKELYIPFFENDYEYYKNLIDECRSHLEIAMNDLEDMNNYLYELKENEKLYTFKELSTKEKRDYLYRHQNKYVFDDLTDDQIDDYFEKFIEISKQSNEIFKQKIGINDNLTLL